MKKSKIVSSWLAFATKLTEKKIYSIFNCRAVEIMLSLFIVTIVVVVVVVVCVVVNVVVVADCYGRLIVFFPCTQYNTSGEHPFCTVSFNLIKNCNLLHMNVYSQLYYGPVMCILHIYKINTHTYKRTNCSVYILILCFLSHSLFLCLFVCLFSFFFVRSVSAKFAARTITIEYEWNKKKTRRETNINSRSSTNQWNKEAKRIRQ